MNDEVPNFHTGQLPDGRWWWHDITGGLCTLGVGATEEDAQRSAHTRSESVLQVIGGTGLRTWRTVEQRDSLLKSMLDDWLADHPTIG